MSRPGLAEAIRAAAVTPAAGPGEAEWSRCPTAVVRIFGVVAGVAYQLDQTESERRRVGGYGAVTNLGMLDALLGLPTGIPVPLESVPTRDRRLLRRAPSGVLEVRGDRVVRRAVVPLTVRFALVTAREWRDGLVKAGRFTPYCARAMTLTRTPEDLADAQVQAAFYGVGVYLFSRGKLTTLVEPEPFTDAGHAPVQWRFAEEVYRQISGTSIGV